MYLGYHGRDACALASLSAGGQAAIPAIRGDTAVKSEDDDIDTGGSVETKLEGKFATVQVDARIEAL